MRHEDQDRKRIDEAGHHRFRHEAHDVAKLGNAGGDLDQPGKHGGREQIFEPVFLDQRDHQHRGCSRCRRDHAGTAADDGGDHRDREGGIEADLGVDTGDDRKGDGFRDQRQGDDEA